MIAKLLRKVITRLYDKDLLTRQASVEGKALQIQERIYRTTILYQVSSYICPLTLPDSFLGTGWGVRVPRWSLGRSEFVVISDWELSRLFSFLILYVYPYIKQWTRAGKHLGTNTSAHYWLQSSDFHPYLFCLNYMILSKGNFA